MMTSNLGWLRFSGAVGSTTADRGESVAAGREALDRWIWQYPWYDSRTDGVRPVDVSDPERSGGNWLADWLDGLFDSGLGLGSMSWLEWLAWGVIAALLIGLAYLMIRVLRARRGSPLESDDEAARQGDVDEQRRVEALPAPVGRKRADLLAEARRCYQHKNYREAIIYLFSYELVLLDRNQHIRLAKGKTNRQYLRELGRRPLLRRLLARTMVVFEEVFFGNYAIDRARADSAWLRLGEFEKLAVEGTT
ncbi:MAG: DUF4129 domain-containing protein [Planctomycetota bacterium]|jgi:hypothetical protein